MKISPEQKRLAQRLFRRLTLGKIVLLFAVIWVTPTLLPHLGALVGIRSGPEARPEFGVVGLDGTSITSKTLRGKVVLVNFWATWCPPCRIEMPLLEAMYQRHQEKGLVVLGLAVDDAPTEIVEEFLRAREISYPIAHVEPAIARRFGDVSAYPTSFLLDRSGQIRHVVVGPIGPLSLEPAVRRLLSG